MALTLPGENEILATDKIGGEHYEYIKIAFGLAGTATIVSSSNPLPIDAKSVIPGTGATNLGKAIDNASGGTDVGIAPLAIRDDVLAAITPIEGDYAPLRVDANGALWVIPSGVVDVTPSSPTAADYLPVRLTDGSSFITAYSAPADDAAFTPATDKVIASGYFADETTPDSVNEGDIGIARMTLDRWVRVALDARSDVGCDFFKSIDLDETEEEVKATAATLYGGIVINMKATPLYLKIYNATAATVVVGTTAPSLTIPIPSQGTTNGAGFTIPIPAIGVKFGTALTVACTTGIADADTGAPGVNECAVALFYK